MGYKSVLDSSPRHVPCLGTSLNVPLTSIAAEGNPPPLFGWTLDWSKDSMPFCLPSVLEWKSTQAPFSTLGALQGSLAFRLGLCGTSPFVPGSGPSV